MSRNGYRVRARAHRFPRVSGDEPAAYGVVAQTPLFSPRERG